MSEPPRPLTPPARARSNAPRRREPDGEISPTSAKHPDVRRFLGRPVPCASLGFSCRTYGIQRPWTRINVLEGSIAWSQRRVDNRVIRLVGYLAWWVGLGKLAIDVQTLGGEASDMAWFGVPSIPLNACRQRAYDCELRRVSSGPY
jgi:hypothetical protein